MSQSVSQSVQVDTTFDLSGENLSAIADYQQWRDVVINSRRPSLADLLVEVADPYQLSVQEKQDISERCIRYNMVIYEILDPEIRDKSLVHALGQQLGLVQLDSNLRADEDSVSSLQVRSQAGNQYIPYTNKALSWHTDGYYNRLDKQIFAIIMHCVRPAEQRGVNRLLDPRQVYIALRESDPAYVEALIHPQAMTIPDNVENGKVIRAAQSGPVFLIKSDGRLHMRYSARKRNIIWRDTPETKAAVSMINELLADDNNVLQVGLKPGQGIICNNVLHNRTGFTDGKEQGRLVYRARYYDAVHQMNNE
jgi:alpha-ketoglutarate-dependent taurine dioxygenase